MPPHQAHLAKARENITLYETMRGMLSPDWKATVLFYAGLHLVEVLAHANDNLHNTVHSRRSNYVKYKHPKIHGAYARLRAESEKARYLTTRHDDWQRGSFSLSSENVHKQLRLNALQKIIDYVEEQCPGVIVLPLPSVQVEAAVSAPARSA